MTDLRALDGRAVQGWGGSAPDGVHVNVFTARPGSACGFRAARGSR
jgi:hypothetical protein